MQFDRLVCTIRFLVKSAKFRAIFFQNKLYITQELILNVFFFSYSEVLKVKGYG